MAISMICISMIWNHTDIHHKRNHIHSLALHDIINISKYIFSYTISNNWCSQSSLYSRLVATEQGSSPLKTTAPLHSARYWNENLQKENFDWFKKVKFYRWVSRTYNVYNIGSTVPDSIQMCFENRLWNILLLTQLLFSDEPGLMSVIYQH